MDPSYPAEAHVYREKVQAFLAEHLPAGWTGIGALPREISELRLSRRLTVGNCSGSPGLPRNWRPIERATLPGSKSASA